MSAASTPTASTPANARIRSVRNWRIPALVAVGGGNVAGLLLGVVSGVLSARVLGPTGRGEFVVVQTWAGWVGVLLTLGVSQAVVIYDGPDDDLARPLCFQAAAVLAVSFGLFVVLLASGTQSWMSPVGIFGGAALTAGSVMISNSAGLAQRRGRMTGEFQRVRLIPQALGVLVIIWLWRAGTRESNTWLLALGLTTLLPAAVMMVIPLGGPPTLWKMHGWLPPRQLVRGAQSAFVLVVGSSVIYRLDGLLVAVWLSSEKVALYAVAIGAAAACATIGQTAGMLVFSQLRGITESDQRRRLIRRGIARALVVTSAVAIPLIAIAPRAIQFAYGSAFVPSSDATRLLVLASIPLAADYLLVHALLSMGAGRTAFRIQVLAGLVTIALLITAVPTGQLVLIASVSVAVYSASATLLFAAAMRRAAPATAHHGRYMSSQPQPPHVTRRPSEGDRDVESDDSPGASTNKTVPEPRRFTAAVIVHWGNPDPTVALVRELGGRTGIDEVIVIANDLSSRPPDIAASAVWIVPPRNLGFAGGFDHGCRSRPYADRYLLLNNDVDIDEECIQECQRVLDDPSIGVVAPILVNSGGLQSAVGRISVPLFKGTTLNLPDTDHQACDAQWVTGAVMLIRARCYGHVGFNLSYFLGWEDADFCFRIRSKGWRVVVATRAKAWHRGGATIPLSGSSYYGMRNRIWFSRRWGTRSQACLVWLWLATVLTPRMFVADGIKRRGTQRTRSAVYALVHGLERLPNEHAVSPIEPRPARWVQWS